MNESTARGFIETCSCGGRFKVGSILEQVSHDPLQAIPRYTEPTGRPPMLGALDKQVQSYLRSVSDRMVDFKKFLEVRRGVAVSVAKTLIKHGIS